MVADDNSSSSSLTIIFLLEYEVVEERIFFNGRLLQTYYQHLQFFSLIGLTICIDLFMQKALSLN